MLSSAVHRPDTAFEGNIKYESLDEKGAALLHSLIKNHPFQNGNKRTALVACLIYYDRAGATIDASEDELYTFLTDIAEGKISNISEKEDTEAFFKEMVSWLKRHKHVYTRTAGETSITDFIENCRTMGAKITTEKKGGSYGISYQGKSIRLSMETKRIGASAMKRYLASLGMSQAHSGINFDEFVNGTFATNNIFRKILPVLRKLALT